MSAGFVPIKDWDDEESIEFCEEDKISVLVSQIPSLLLWCANEGLSG